jgi:hypothetical protein
MGVFCGVLQKVGAFIEAAPFKKGRFLFLRGPHGVWGFSCC